MRKHRAGLSIAALLMALLGSFAWHGVHGGRGMDRLIRVEAERGRLHAEVDRLREARATLEKRVGLLRPESLDPDMLDESARSVLEFSHPSDLVILRGR